MTFNSPTWNRTPCNRNVTRSIPVVTLSNSQPKALQSVRQYMGKQGKLMPDDILQHYKSLLNTSSNTYLINNGDTSFEKLRTTTKVHEHHLMCNSHYCFTQTVSRNERHHSLRLYSNLPRVEVHSFYFRERQLFKDGANGPPPPPPPPQTPPQ